MTRHYQRSGKAAIAVLLTGIVLLLNAMAACPSLHEKIHKDADNPTHECAATLFAHGKVDSATVEVAVVAAAAAVVPAPKVEFFVYSPAIQNLPQGRAPPAVSSPQA
jgi:hypothetical protein